MELLGDLQGVVCLIDDVLVHGSTKDGHNQNLDAVLKRMQEANLTLNEEKCQFCTTEVHFLGQIVDVSGVRPDPEKVAVIQNFPKPTCVGDIRQFLGMVNQLNKFTPNLADKTKPLNNLLVKKNQWVWGDVQQKAFSKVKESLTTTPVLALYDPTKPTTVSADTSAFGLGAVLMQDDPGKGRRPVAYISRTMSPTELRYAQIEKEALSITWACDRFSEFLIGMEFEIQTDHKPLVPLLRTKQLDDLPPRILRFRLRYQFSIYHVPGNCQSGWPHIGELPPILRPYYQVSAELTMEDAYGLLMRGRRIVIPSSMRVEMLGKLHEGHQGIFKCRERARNSVWWPRLSRQLEDVVKSCSEC